MFVSTYESAIDAKGRVSIPAPFRAALGGGTRIFLWPALDGSGCLEGGGEALMAMYRATLTRLAPQSEVRKALVTRIIAGSADLKMDETGRIKLPEDLCKAADLTDRIKFAGNIDSFQIWNPEKHAALQLCDGDGCGRSRNTGRFWPGLFRSPAPAGRRCLSGPETG